MYLVGMGWGAKATSEAVIAKLNSAIVEILADPRLREHFAARGQADAGPRARDSRRPCAAAEGEMADVAYIRSAALLVIAAPLK